MRVGVIIFARMSSSRLPGKALCPVGDRPLLGRVFDRVQLTTCAAGIALATSVDPTDDALVSFCDKEGVGVYRGPLDDVALRAFECARAHDWDAFVRVCGDRPFVVPATLDAAIRQVVARAPRRTDLASNLLKGRVAPGLTVEIVNTESLGRILDESDNPEDREHLTRYFYTHRKRFELLGLNRPSTDTEGLRFVVDTKADLLRTQYVVERISDPVHAGLAEVVVRSREWEERVARAKSIA